MPAAQRHSAGAVAASPESWRGPPPGTGSAGWSRRSDRPEAPAPASCEGRGWYEGQKSGRTSGLQAGQPCESRGIAGSRDDQEADADLYARGFAPRTSKLFKLPAEDAKDGFTYPVAQYDHDEGNAVMGGFVYRGRAIPEL